MAHIAMAHIVMAHIVMAHIVMANMLMFLGSLCSNSGLYSHGLYSYGPYSYGKHTHVTWQLVLKSLVIAELMKLIWSMREATLDIDTLKSHAAYRAVLSSAVLQPKSEWLLEQGVEQMYIAANAYAGAEDSHKRYILRNGQILYKISGRDEYGPSAGL